MFGMIFTAGRVGRNEHITNDILEGSSLVVTTAENATVQGGLRPLSALELLRLCWNFFVPGSAFYLRDVCSAYV